MRDLKWHYILGIAVGITIIVAVVVWIIRATDLVAKISQINSPPSLDSE